MNKDRGEEYITAFPRFRKWINECLCCHKKGYDPNMPEHIGDTDDNLGAYFIKKYFKPMPVNAMGLCPQCEKFFIDKT